MSNAKVSKIQLELMNHIIMNKVAVCHNAYAPAKALVRRGYIKVMLTRTEDVFCHLTEAGVAYLDTQRALQTIEPIL